MDPHIADLVNGKRVIIVGRSMHLVERPREAQGEFIDSFDVVVRWGRPLPFISHHPPIPYLAEEDEFIPKRYQGKLGSKTRIIMCGEMWNIEGHIFKPRYRVERFIEAGGDTLIYGTDEKFNKNFISYIGDYNIYSLQVDISAIHNRYPKTNLFGGHIAIAYFLEYDVKELHVIGYSCRYPHPDLWRRNTDNVKWMINQANNDDRLELEGVVWELMDMLQ